MTTATPENVDLAELAKFNSLASRWWDTDGEFASLHEINPLRMDWILQHVKIAGTNVVDIGCGGGILAESMAASNATVTGIDMAEGPLAVARLHQHESVFSQLYCFPHEWPHGEGSVHPPAERRG